MVNDSSIASFLFMLQVQDINDIMTAILQFLSAPFFQKPVSPDPFQTHWIVGIVYKLHTMTGSLLFGFRYF